MQNSVLPRSVADADADLFASRTEPTGRPTSLRRHWLPKKSYWAKNGWMHFAPKAIETVEGIVGAFRLGVKRSWFHQKTFCFRNFFWNLNSFFERFFGARIVSKMSRFSVEKIAFTLLGLDIFWLKEEASFA